MYEFNPYENANHTKRTFLGAPGTPTTTTTKVNEDPKYKGPCGEIYQKYRYCLKKQEFNRPACEGQENDVIKCEREKLSDMSAKIKILLHWRQNKNQPVKDPYTPIKFFDTEPEILRNREVKEVSVEEED